MFRRAVQHYIQCLFGIRHDDYNYAHVNELLPRPLKKYIKTVCCYPERCTLDDYKKIMSDFQDSERVSETFVNSASTVHSVYTFQMYTRAASFPPLFPSSHAVYRRRARKSGQKNARVSRRTRLSESSAGRKRKNSSTFLLRLSLFLPPNKNLSASLKASKSSITGATSPSISDGREGIRRFQ